MCTASLSIVRRATVGTEAPPINKNSASSCGAPPPAVKRRMETRGAGNAGAAQSSETPRTTMVVSLCLPLFVHEPGSESLVRLLNTCDARSWVRLLSSRTSFWLPTTPRAAEVYMETAAATHSVRRPKFWPRSAAQHRPGPVRELVSTAAAELRVRPSPRPRAAEPTQAV